MGSLHLHCKWHHLESPLIQGDVYWTKRLQLVNIMNKSDCFYFAVENDKLKKKDIAQIFFTALHISCANEKNYYYFFTVECCLFSKYKSSAKCFKNKCGKTSTNKYCQCILYRKQSSFATAQFYQASCWQYYT